VFEADLKVRCLSQRNKVSEDTGIYLLTSTHLLLYNTEELHQANWRYYH